MSTEGDTPKGDTPNADTPNEVSFHYVLHCPCGTALTGLTEDEIVEVSFAHLREQHPEMADTYEREHILFMAQRLVKGR